MVMADVLFLAALIMIPIFLFGWWCIPIALSLLAIWLIGLMIKEAGGLWIICKPFVFVLCVCMSCGAVYFSAIYLDRFFGVALFGDALGIAMICGAIAFFVERTVWHSIVAWARNRYGDDKSLRDI